MSCKLPPIFYYKKLNEQNFHNYLKTMQLKAKQRDSPRIFKKSIQTFILICVTWKADSVPVERMMLACLFPVSVRKPLDKEYATTYLECSEQTFPPCYMFGLRLYNWCAH